MERHPSVDWGAVDDVISAARTRRARTTATSRAWRCCWPACRSDVPGTTVNRLCGSGLEAVASAARAIGAGEGELVIAGGVESMIARAVRDGQVGRRRSRGRRTRGHDPRLALRQPEDEAAVRRRLDARDRGKGRGDYGISREDQDASRSRASSARGAHRARVLRRRDRRPSTIAARKGDADRGREDEHPRPDTTLEALATLKPIVTPGRHGDGGQCQRASTTAPAALLLVGERAPLRTG